MKKTTLLTALLILSASIASADWRFGIGAGVGLFDLDGDVTLPVGGMPTPVDIKYDTGDIESAFGLNGYAANGPWVFKGSYAMMELEANQTIKGGANIQNLNFERVIWDLSAGYNLAADDEAMDLVVFGGVRSYDHEWSANGVDIDEDWMDALVGLTFSLPFADAWTWNNTAEATFGDSEGTFGAKTGVAWRFADNWSASFDIGYYVREFEESTYEYDVDEFKGGLGIVFHF